jgi:endonuclease/exonuclease/phosphatase (EEP) superfamily protein YafD
MEFTRSLVGAVLMTVVVGCAAAAVAAHLGRWSPRFDILAHLAPIWLAGALVGLIYALILEAGWWRGAMAVLGAAGVIGSALLIAPEYMRAKSPPVVAGTSGEIKLIQFNAWRDNRDPETTIRWLLAQDADIIVMEEGERIGQRLARRGGYHIACGGCDVMILSKAKPTATGAEIDYSGGPRPPMVRATFTDARGEFTVVGTHYIWPTFGGVQQAQGRVLHGLLKQFPTDRLILSGDLNSTPWSFSRRSEDRMFRMERRTRALFSWPAGAFLGPIALPFPILPIDQVYAGAGWRTVSVERGPRLGSDHYPVVLRLAPSPEG